MPFGIGYQELLLFLLLGVLLFGRKLPEVGKYLGKSIVEFRKSISGIEDEVQGTINRQEVAPEPVRPPQRVTSPAPKFEDTAAPPKI